MSSRLEKNIQQGSEKSKLSEPDLRLLLVVCVELVNFCAKVTGKIDPAASAMLTYVRDDMRFENKSLLPEPKRVARARN
jgi:hypothetical protein